MKQEVLKRVSLLYDYLAKGDERFCSKFAEMIGSNGKTISQQMKGERAISLDTILNILLAFPDISSEWLLRGKGKMTLTDNMPTFNGEETESEEDLKIELSKVEAELEEYKLQNLRLEAQKDYLQDRNDDLIITNRMLQDELNKYQEPKRKSII